jgi:hypothetical protein
LLQRSTPTKQRLDNDVEANADPVRTVEDVHLWLGFRGMPDHGGRCRPIDLTADRFEFVTIPTHACGQYITILFGVSPDKSGGAVDFSGPVDSETISDFGSLVSDTTDPDECIHWEVTLQVQSAAGSPVAPSSATIDVEWILPPGGAMRLWYLTWQPGQRPPGEVTI